jgi:hypothetical protein
MVSVVLALIGVGLGVPSVVVIRHGAHATATGTHITNQGLAYGGVAVLVVGIGLAVIALTLRPRLPRPPAPPISREELARRAALQQV